MCMTHVHERGKTKSNNKIVSSNSCNLFSLILYNNT